MRTETSESSWMSDIAAGSRHKRMDAHQRVSGVLFQNQWTTVVVRAWSLGVEILSQCAECICIGHGSSKGLTALGLSDDTDTGKL